MVCDRLIHLYIKKQFVNITVGGDIPNSKYTGVRFISDKNIGSMLYTQYRKYGLFYWRFIQYAVNTSGRWTIPS